MKPPSSDLCDGIVPPALPRVLSSTEFARLLLIYVTLFLVAIS
jgi:hypothetical protein